MVSYRFLLMKPGTDTASISGTYISDTSTYVSTNANASAAGVLFLDLQFQTELMMPYSKKTNVTRYANRGSVHIDLRDMFKEFAIKDIYLGNMNESPTHVSNQQMIYDYIFQEWPKTGTGKIRPLWWIEASTTIVANAFKTYYRGSFVDWTGRFKGALVPSIDIQGNYFIKQLEMEEHI